MKVLIVGSGGREHAIATAVAKSSRVDKIYCAPGNAGIASLAECVNIGAMEFDKLVAFAKENATDFTIIGMDDPLVGGVVDAFEAEGLKVFGPRKNAAILEGSKAFSKDLMKKYNIPTAAYENFDDADKALAYLETAKFPIVLKADGLALGKGVLICNTLEEAKDGVKEIMEDKKFGTAGNTMVVEEFMTGREVSVLSFVDGNTIKTMTSAIADIKPTFEESCPIGIINFEIWEWTQGVGLYTLWQYYKLSGDVSVRERIEKWFADRFKEGLPEKNVNTMCPMLTMACLYEET